MSKTIEVKFELNPPSAADSLQPVPSCQNYVFPFAVPSGSPLSSSDFYTSLRNAISDAKNQTGEDLTKYRDLAGDLEKNKVPATKPASDDEEEDGEEE